MIIRLLRETREDLAQRFKGIGVEVGVEQGVYSEIICKNSNVKKLYAVDAWKHYSEYFDHVNQIKLDKFYEISKIRLSPYNCEIVRKFSIEASKDFMGECLDFVYIDANHSYKFVTEDLNAWFPKVKKGGVVSGHDYIVRSRDQKKYYDVISAVNDFAKEKEVEELIIYNKEPPASWCFIKK